MNIVALITFLTADTDNVIVFCVREVAAQAEQAVLDAPCFPALMREFGRTSIIVDAGSTFDSLVQQINEQSGAGPQVIYGSDSAQLLRLVQEIGNALIGAWGGSVEFEGFPYGNPSFLLTSNDLLVARVFGHLIFERVTVAPPHEEAPPKTHELDALDI